MSLRDGMEMEVAMEAEVVGVMTELKEAGVGLSRRL